MKARIPLPAVIAAGLLLIVSLAVCGGGVPQEELDAVNAQLDAERAKTADFEARLQQAEEIESRLKQAAHLEAARGLLADGWALPGPQVLAFLADVQNSDDPDLKAGMGDLLQGFISSLDSLPPELIGQALAAVQGAGDLKVADAVQALLFAVAQGGGGPELLAVAQAVHASQSQPLEDVVSSILSAVLGGQESDQLVLAISDLATTSTDTAVQQSLELLRQPPDEFIQQVREHLDAANVPTLQDAFQKTYLAPDWDPSGLYDMVTNELRQTLALPAPVTQ